MPLPFWGDEMKPRWGGGLPRRTAMAMVSFVFAIEKTMVHDREFIYIGLSE